MVRVSKRSRKWLITDVIWLDSTNNDVGTGKVSSNSENKGYKSKASPAGNLFQGVEKNQTPVGQREGDRK